MSLEPAARTTGGDLVRVRVDLAYDGSGFAGWARQPGMRTVQGVVEAALARVLRLDTVSLTCAGRTDAGVHARGQVAHLDVPAGSLRDVGTRSDPDWTRGLRRRLSGVLTDDVAVLRCAQAPAGFDARFGALWRRYAYRVCDDPAVADPVRRGHVLRWTRPLDLAAMNAAAASLLGEHDFAAYCRRRAGASTVREVHQLCWARDAAGRAVLHVRADAFCHHMVRAVAGALLGVGEGRRAVGWPAEVLAAVQREPAVLVLPAHGLTLEEVGYPDDPALAARAEQTRATHGPLAPGGLGPVASSPVTCGQAGRGR